MSLRFNVKFAAILLVLCIVCGGSVHLLHGYQLKRNAGVFLDRANRAEQEAEAADAEAKTALYHKEMEHLRHYLTFRPTDTEARARLGLLAEKLARTGKDFFTALIVYDTVLRQDPARKDIRLRAAKVALLLGRHDDALNHLTTLGALDSSDGELHTLYGRALEQKGDYKGAREHYAKAVTLPPVQLETYTAYAALLRRHISDPEAANKLMEQMVKDTPTAEAFLVLSAYWKEFDKSKSGAERAARALAEAQKREPDNADVLLQSAEAARQTSDMAAARKFLQRGIEKHPADARMYLALSALEQQAGRRSEAVALLRRGLEAKPGQIDLLWALADLRVGDGEESEMADLLAQMKKGGLASAQLDYLRARLLLAKGRWRDSADLLERTRPGLEAWPALVRHSDLLLARCYEQLGDVDQRYTVYQRLVSADPLSIPGNLGLGAALEALGREEDALKAYQRLLRLEGVGSQARLRVARLLIRRNQQRPPAEQQWEEVDRLLSGERQPPEREADASRSDAVETAILRAAAWMARGQAQQAEQVLKDARKAHPKEVTLWVALTELAEQRKQPKEADALLDEAERTLGDSVALRLARASQALRRDAAKSLPVLAKLAEGAEKFPEDDQVRLLRGLAAAHSLANDRDGAARLWTRLAELRPNDLSVRIAQFDLALLSKDPSAINRAIDAIRNIEGADGSLWKYARAAQLVEEARSGERNKLVEAQGLLEEVMIKRPSWPRAPVCLALAEELAGYPEQAIRRYQQAVELGDHSVTTIRSLVQLLYQRRRFADAEAALRQLPQPDAMPSDLQRLAAEVSLRTHANPDHALRLAQQAVTADSKDYRDHLWLGQMLAQSQAHAAEAEKALRRALALAENEPATWFALVQFLTRTGKKKEAEALLAQAESKLPPDKSALTLAACYETVDQLDRAKELYRNALAAHPEDPDTLTNAAKFYLRTGASAEAEKCLNRLMESKAHSEDAAWARRMLAFVLHARGDYQHKRQALSLLNILDDPLADTALKEMPVEEIRARAALLARSWERRQRQEAIRLLESLGTRQPLSAVDQFMLGQLYESIGKWNEASRRLGAAVSAESDNLVYLASYINSLLRHQEWTAAVPWLAKLEQKQPNSLVTVQLKARLLQGEGKNDEAVAAVMSYTRNKDADLRQAALLLESIGRTADAGALFHRLAQDGKRPEAALEWAAFLGRQGRTQEALDECERAAAKGKIANVAETFLLVLYTASEPGPYCERVERWLTQAAASQEGRRLDFMPYIAALRNIQGKYAESEALYRQILAKQPNDVLALNNLAFLMAEYEGKPADALALLKQAWEQAGPSAVLSDTRAVVYLKLGEAKKAVEELEELVSNSPRPEAYFHLAQAHETAGDRVAARLAFLKGQELKLKLTSLHPLERRAYQQMVQRFHSEPRP
jgi:tetratricopeptide (TPR) repeat protein